MSKKTYLQAINEAVRQEMQRDPRVIVLGEDVAGGQGASGEAGGVDLVEVGVVQQARLGDRVAEARDRVGCPGLGDLLGGAVGLRIAHEVPAHPVRLRLDQDRAAAVTGPLGVLQHRAVDPPRTAHAGIFGSVR